MHFTHVRNLPGILEAGCLQADSLVDRGSALLVEAADLGIKAEKEEDPHYPRTVRVRGRLCAVLLRAAITDGL